MNTYDVVVIGGGAAGLNGALLLARSRRSVSVIDAGTPRNAPARGVHGLLGHDGLAPSELLERGRSEVRRYGGAVESGEVTSVTRDGDRFVVSLADGRSPDGTAALVTTGLVDDLPDIAGLRERWGRDVLHCPYCHGWEVRDPSIGVLANGPRSVHQALLFRQLSDRVTYFANAIPLSDEEVEQLAWRRHHRRKRRGVKSHRRPTSQRRSVRPPLRVRLRRSRSTPTSLPHRGHAAKRRLRLSLGHAGREPTDTTLGATTRALGPSNGADGTPDSSASLSGDRKRQH